MRFGLVPRSSSAVPAAFLAVAALSSVLVGALGWQLIEQDRQLQQAREAEQMDQAVHRFASSRSAQAPVIVSLSEPTVVARHGTLVYLPVVPPSAPEAPPEVFEHGERLEYAENYREAAREFDRLARDAHGPVRAGALGRLARVQRKLSDVESALRAYVELDQFDSDASIDGFPAGLYARLGRAGAFEEAGRTDALRAEARALADDLGRARWPLSREAYAALRNAATKWLGADVAIDGEAVVYADAVDWLWNNRSELRSSPERGRRVTLPGGAEIVVAWEATDSGLRAAVAAASYLAQVRTDARQKAAERRTLLLVAFAATGLVLCAGWYFIVRSMVREQRTLRLQHDFVAAVSHEFRSPLTSMAHVAEMLDERRIDAEPERRAAYRTLVRDTGRLRRLVDDLLDFRRFASGPHTLRTELADVVDVVRATVADVQRRALTHRIEMQYGDTPVLASIDRDAVARAVTNLLDNAMKYSPGSHTVWVSIRAQDSLVTITVRDQGIGIPYSEQRHIFDAFVRGAQANAMRIKGTGIGLALVRQIARAHGGDVSVSSEPGAGSSFSFSIHAASGAAS